MDKNDDLETAATEEDAPEQETATDEGSSPEQDTATAPEASAELEAAPAEAAPDEEAATKVEANPAHFAELADGIDGDGTSLERFYDVNVSVWAELGRVSMSLGELLRLGPGSVVKLNRTVSAPVDLMAQGVRVARGEVVVVDDHFAVRIKEIEASRKSFT